MSIVLGLDFGHCEVAVSLTMEGRKPENLILDGNKAKVLPAQIALTRQQIQQLKSNGNSRTADQFKALGNFEIGDDAAPKNDENSDTLSFLYFKKAPAYFDELVEGQVPRGTLMAAYLYRLIEQILMYNPDYLDPSDRNKIELQVGCPTTEEWTGEGKASKYAELILRATGVKAVHIVPESRAAMFSSIESTQACISAARGAVVFDFGSSTADCTYMLMGRRCIEYSWRLGAQAIEAQMTRVAFDGQNPSLASRVYVTNQLRKQKELFYSGSFGPKGQRLFYDVQDRDGNDIEAYIRINEDQMDEVTAGEDHEIEILCDSTQSKFGTWRSLCLDFFQAAKDMLEDENLPCSNIVLTGGASKMPFVLACCQKVFGDSVAIHLEKNPSFSVANGLGWVSTIDARVSQSEEQAIQALLAIQEISVQTLRDSVAQSIHPIIAEVVADQANLWAQATEDLPMQWVLDAINKVMGSAAIRNEMQKAIAKEIDGWKEKFKKKVTEKVNAGSKNLMTDKIADSLVLTDGVWNQLGLAELNIGEIDVTQLISKINFNSLWFYLWEFLGAFIWILPGMRDRNDKQMPRKQSERIDMKNNMIIYANGQQMVQEIVQNVGNALDKAEKAYPKIVRNIVERAFAVVTLRHFED